MENTNLSGEWQKEMKRMMRIMDLATLKYFLDGLEEITRRTGFGGQAIEVRDRKLKIGETIIRTDLEKL